MNGEYNSVKINEEKQFLKASYRDNLLNLNFFLDENCKCTNIAGFHSILLHGQGLVVNFTHIDALWIVQASKFPSYKLHIRAAKHKVNTYEEYFSQSDNSAPFSVDHQAVT